MSAHGCHNGWLGKDDDNKPIPCVICRPHLVKTAHINDCGQAQEPLRRHPIEDVWLSAITAEFADEPLLDRHAAPIPAGLNKTTLVISTSSLPWASAIRARTESLIGRINSRPGLEAISTIIITTETAAPCT
ncbi:DciA family protein [Nocardia sp. NPDC050175]|uniref:DciA family protein n=1 Tax=Nocardia sp. NPDC050175 TaxID=3364317 RepID=UPI0037B9DE4E